jgi:hypothetical protein
MRLHCEIRSEASFPPRSGFVQPRVPGGGTTAALPPCGPLNAGVRQRNPNLPRAIREFRYDLNGFRSGTPKALKSATFLVTTVKP